MSGLGELERRAFLEWVGENLPHVRRSAFGQRILYWSLGIGFVIGGLACRRVRAQVVGDDRALRFAGDLLYTLGWALWTGVVVALFPQLLPEAKRSQFKQALNALEEASREAAAGEGPGRRGHRDAAGGSGCRTASPDDVNRGESARRSIVQ
jgi:hypothetical protein